MTLHNHTWNAILDALTEGNAEHENGAPYGEGDHYAVVMITATDVIDYASIGAWADAQTGVYVVHVDAAFEMTILHTYPLAGDATDDYVAATLEAARVTVDRAARDHFAN